MIPLPPSTPSLRGSSHEDAADLHAWRTGDRDAGARLLQRYQRALRRYFQRRAPVVADDLVQRTLLAVVEHRHQILDPHQVRRYVFGIAWRMLARERAAVRHAPFDEIHDEAPQPTHEPLEDRCDARRRAAALRQGLRSVSSTNRRAMELFYLEGYRGREVAEALRIPPATVRSRLIRGVTELRGALA